MLLNLSSRILDDAGFVFILHAGSLESSQQIADTLDVMEGQWRLFVSYDVLNDIPSYMPYSKLEHYYSKCEVIVKSSSTPSLPKQEYWPFDKANSGRESLLLLNFNSKMAEDRGEKANAQLPDLAKSMVKKSFWLESSPSPKSLPVYAEQQAQVLQNVVTPASVRANLRRHDIHGRNLFVDDKAKEASSDSPQV
ncbi:hypothetical protein R1sor_000190 [Riccia sorocarpa]|uniref:Uncharacterized protein n=1 Tax=Riccia sorocarpa TaxID=122646 RepID=A0ABD3GSM3_9MARC